MVEAGGVSEEQLLADALRGDEAAFERLVERHRGELYAHCYRMLGSVQDAEDAVQESLLGAWRGLAAFEGRSSLRTWLFRVTTNACLRLSARRPRRMLSSDHGPAVSIAANGQPAFACYQYDGQRFRLGAVNVLSLRNGRISWIAGFVDPQVFRHFSVPGELSRPDR